MRQRTHIFDTEEEAQSFFKPSDWDGEHIEQCECCGKFSISQADRNDGAIIGPIVDDKGDNVFDRVCDICDLNYDPAKG